MTIRLAIILLLSAKVLLSQEIGQWQNYSNMKEINDIVSHDNIIWAATSGGVFSTNLSEYDNLLTKSEGLSSQNITAIAVDQQNQIWLGTDDGVINILDENSGDIRKIFDINRTENTRKAINSIYISDGTAYISIDFGLSIINTTTLEFVETVLKFGNLPSNSKVNSIYKNNIIYANTENGLAIQKQNTTNLANPESWNSTLVGIEAGDIPAGDILCSVIYSSNLYIGTDQGLFMKDNNSWIKIINETEPVSDLEIYDRTLYVLYSNSLYSYRENNAQLIYNEGENELNNIFIDNSSRFLIASSEGIIELTSTSVQNYYPNGPATNNFISVSVDDESNLWAATGKDGRGKGFIKFDQQDWKNYNKASDTNITTNDYHKVFSYDGKTLLCTWGFGFSIIAGDELNHYDASNTILEGISDNHNFVVIQDLKLDNSKNIWAFNHWPYNGGSLFMMSTDGDQYSFRFPYFSFSANVFLDNGEVDDYNTKWFSIHNNGLFYFNENGTLEDQTDDVWGRLGQTEYFNSRDITCLAVDNRNELWVGTSLGIKIIPDPSRPTGQMLPVFPLRQQSINCIAVDPLNQKWVGTSQGLFHVTSDGSALLAQYDSKNSPLPTDNIQSIAVDKNTGTVYIGTEFGLSSLTTTSVEPNEDYSELFVYPNPFIIGDSHNDFIQIDGLVENSSLKILSLSGKLVNEYETAGGRIDFWDGRDLDGSYVSTGIYLIVAFDQEANKVKTTKIAVIRK